MTGGESIRHHNTVKGKTGSFFHKIAEKFRHGLVLHTITYRLARIGIDISPYYLMKEGLGRSKLPVIKGNPSEYSYSFFGPAEMVSIVRNHPWWRLENKLNSINEKQKCFGLKHKEEIAALMWINFEKCSYKKNTFLLKDNEVYFTNMYTVDTFRGKNLAPFLRYHCMQILAQMGRDTFYSITEYFNTPALKFKKKLNATIVKLYLNLKLFRRYEWVFTLKNYE